MFVNFSNDFIITRFLFVVSCSSTNDVGLINSLCHLFFFFWFVRIIIIFIWSFQHIWNFFVFLWKSNSQICWILLDDICISNDECIGKSLWGFQVFEVNLNKEWVSFLNLSFIWLCNWKNVLLMFEACSMSKSRAKMFLSPFFTFFVHYFWMSLMVDLTDFCPNFEILDDCLIDLE